MAREYTVRIVPQEEHDAEVADLQRRFDQLIEIASEACVKSQKAPPMSVSYASWGRIAHHATSAARGYKTKLDLLNPDLES